METMKTLEEYKKWFQEQKKRDGGYYTSVIEQRIMKDEPLSPLEIEEARELLKIQRGLLSSGYYADVIGRNLVRNGVTIEARRRPAEKIKELSEHLVWVSAYLEELYLEGKVQDN